MKKAFTMMELVFVIVVVGILSAMIAPNFQRNSLREAADQLISHIRYTQHLAMMDDKFDPNDPNWFKRRWTLRLKQDLVYSSSLPPAGTYNNVWTYSIYSDLPNYASHQPDLAGMAKNPLNTNQYLSGGYNNVLHVKDDKSMKDLRLGEKYGVANIVFSGGCRSTMKYINFDYLGRPSNSFPGAIPYELATPGYHKLLTVACNITLSNGTKNISIAIEPETGYVHIL